MRRLNKKALIASILFVIMLIIPTGVAAQDVPSHTQVSPSPAGVFDFPEQLAFFASLASSSNGIIANVTQGNFTAASALLAAYNRTVSDLNAAANNAQQDPTITALGTSFNDWAAFIRNAQRYNELYVNETTLIPQAARSNGSIANALEIQALSGTLNGLVSTIGGRNADIFDVAVDNGLDLSRYGNSTALLNAYTRQLDSRLANVTGSVFLTPTLTMTGTRNSATYGDRVVLAGNLSNNQTGGIGGAVELHIDNTTVATVRTNATGSYTYPLVIQTLAPGTHVAFATYTPKGEAYNPAQSPKLPFTVAASPVTNSLTVVSRSIALGSDLQARGTLTSPNGPVPNATVSLLVGDADVAQTRTDRNGTYSFSVPAAGLYLPSLLNGATVHTVFEPAGQPLERSESAPVLVPADTMAAYGTIVAVTFVALLGIALYSRSGRKRPTAPAKEAEPTAAVVQKDYVPATVVGTTLPAAAPALLSDWYAAREQARRAFAKDDDEKATQTLFNAAIATLSAATGARIATSMTHWEKFWAIQAALPRADLPLRKLTRIYELANYGGRPLTVVQRDTAVTLFDALRPYTKRQEGRQ